MKPTEKAGESEAPCGVLLAAGTSSRMSDFKLLLPYKNKPILQHVIDAIRASKLDKVIVVLGYNRETLLDKVDFSGIEIVFNPEFKMGQSASLKTGLSHVSTLSSAAIFILGDQPLITSAIIDRLVDSYQQSKSKIVLPTYKGRRGNPVIMNRSLFPELMMLTGDTGGRELIRKYHKFVTEVEMNDKAVIGDIDTDEDYQRLMSNGRER